MSYDFSGTNQNLRSAENGVANIDTDDFTMACWVNPDTEGSYSIFALATAFAAGGNVRAIVQRLPSVSGMVVEFAHSTPGTNGIWQTDNDYSITGWTHVAVTMDASGNPIGDPLLYVNGSSVAITETQTPDDARITGIDSVTIGENAAGGGDYDGKAAEFAIWNRILTPTEIAHLGGANGPAASPALYSNGLVWYVRAKHNANDEIQGANLTPTGATLVADHPTVIYPGAVHHELDASRTKKQATWNLGPV